MASKLITLLIEGTDVAEVKATLMNMSLRTLEREKKDFKNYLSTGNLTYNMCITSELILDEIEYELGLRLSISESFIECRQDIIDDMIDSSCEEDLFIFIDEMRGLLEGDMSKYARAEAERILDDLHDALKRRHYLL